MTLYEFQQNIVGDNLTGIYILSGEEIGIMNYYINQINRQRIRYDTVQEAVIESSRSGKLTKPKCFVVRDDNSFIKDESVWDVVKNAMTKDVLILCITNIDKRSKFYKKFKDDIIWFEKLDADMLIKYLLNDIKEMDKLRQSELKKFIEICDFDYSRMMNELDKIKNYAEFKRIQPSEAYRTLQQQGAFYEPIGDITFKFTDSIIERKAQKAYEYSVKAKNIGESEILTLSVLYNSFKNIFMYQGLGSDRSNPSKRTGLTPWQVRQAKEKADYYSDYELLKIIKLIQEIEYGIKTGVIPIEISIDYLLIKIFGGEF
jgi:DNA polymerase III subunit delta